MLVTCHDTVGTDVTGGPTALSEQSAHIPQEPVLLNYLLVAESVTRLSVVGVGFMG